MSEKTLRVGIVTVSDRASSGEYEDKGGPAIRSWLKNALVTPWEGWDKVVPDEQDQIEAILREFTDDQKCHLILTTGGTGPSKRDVTPEATIAVSERILDGFGERMRSISLKYAPTAILSRQVGVLRGDCLIVNLPGQPKAISEILDELFEAIPYCIELNDGPYIDTDESIVKAFRPKSYVRKT